MICLAFIEMAQSQSLLPASGDARIDALTREALSRNLSDAALAMLYEARTREAAKVSSAWIEAQWAKVASALDAMNAAVPPAGRFDLGDCGWASSLSHVELRFEDRGWRDGRTALADWYEGVKARPSVAAVL